MVQVRIEIVHGELDMIIARRVAVESTGSDDYESRYNL